MSFDGDDATALDGDGDALTGDLNNLQLYVDGVQIGTTKSAMTDGTPDSVTFTGLALLVPKNTSKVVELRANVIGANTTIFIGMDMFGRACFRGIRFMAISESPGLI